ncbi:MAG: hypothetical protein ACMZ63_06470 [Methylotenera sp.]
MSFREGCRLFGYQIPVFFGFGLLLMSGFNFYNQKTKDLLENVFFEHFAMNSIIVIFLFCLFMSGLFLLIIGSRDTSNKVHNHIYNYIIKPPIELGINLCSVAFSLSVALGVVVLFIDHPKAIAFLFSLIYIVIVAFLYWGLSAITLENNFLSDREQQKIAGGLMILAVPVMVVFVLPTLKI